MAEIAIVGAFDRHNYGDLLFPLLVRDQIWKRDPNACVGYYGLVSSDLSEYGGVPTRPITEIVDRELRGVVVAGGQILNATWSNMHLNLLPKSKIDAWRALYRAIGSDAANALARRRFRGHSTLPFVIPPSLVGEVPVVYNAVGGTSFPRWSKPMIEGLVSTLNSAQYISVRDGRSRFLLEDFGVKSVHTAPDSAVLVSELQADAPGADAPEAWPSLATGKGSYICFQVGKGYARGQIATITRELRSVMELTDLDIVLLPIGLAAGHQDDEPLRQIQSLLETTGRCTMISRPTIQSTISTISGSRLFAGTSLHGALTAFSFGVRSVGYKAVLKQESTMREILGTSWMSFSTFSDLSKAITSSIESDSSSSRASLNAARQASLSSFEELLGFVM